MSQSDPDSNALAFLLKPFKWLFSVPPIEERPRLTGTLRQWIYGHYDPLISDSVLYYKIYIVNLVAHLVISSLFWLSYVCHVDINLGFYTIKYTSHFITTFLYDYPRRIFPVLIALSFIYALLLFSTVSESLSWRSLKAGTRVADYGQFAKYHNLEWHKYLLVLVFSLVCIPRLDSLPEFFRTNALFTAFFDHPSPTLFLDFNIAYIFLYQLFIIHGFIFPFITVIRKCAYRFLFKPRPPPTK